ncbi:MAG: spore germination protein GerW family protein [Eubacteriales bacterium]
MVEQSKISEMIESSLSKIKEMADTQTIVGAPIHTPGDYTIIPVSKISIGFATGGLDYHKKKEGTAPPRFGGGGGTGVAITPVAFLIISPYQTVDLVPISGGDNQAVDKLFHFVERSPELVERLKSAITSRKKGAEATEG